MIISKEMSIAYTEVLEIIKQLNKTDYEKIPKDRIGLYEKYKNSEYIFNYNKSLPIKEQISNKSKAILSYLFFNYIATEEEKKIIKQKDMEEFVKIEEQRKKAVLNPIFKDKEVQRQEIMQQKALVEINEKNNFFQKIICKIKSFLKKIYKCY